MIQLALLQRVQFRLLDLSGCGDCRCPRIYLSITYSSSIAFPVFLRDTPLNTDHLSITCILNKAVAQSILCAGLNRSCHVQSHEEKAFFPTNCSNLTGSPKNFRIKINSSSYLLKRYFPTLETPPPPALPRTDTRYLCFPL